MNELTQSEIIAMIDAAINVYKQASIMELSIKRDINVSYFLLEEFTDLKQKILTGKQR